MSQTGNSFYPGAEAASIASVRNYLILFLLWPFVAFLTALANFGQKEARKVVYVFLIYYGLNFFIGDTGYVDSMGYARDLELHATLPFSEFLRIIGGLYSSDDAVDIYKPLVSFVVSRFTDDHRVLFGVLAAVFGYFYLRSITLVYNLYQKNPGINALIHLVFFCLIIPITNVNGARMWTAAWIFFYGAINVIFYRDARFLLVAMASSLVHFSFITANAILLIYYFAGNRNFIYLPLTIASFIVPQMISPLMSRLSLLLTGSIQIRYENYTNEAYISGIRDLQAGNRWFVQGASEYVFYYLIISIALIQLFQKYLMTGNKEKNLFSFVLLFLSFVNFGSAIPSLGNRFQLVFFLFATLFLLLYFINNPERRLLVFTILGIFPMLLYSAVTFRIGAFSINAWIFGPGLGTPFFVPGLSIAELLFN